MRGMLIALVFVSVHLCTPVFAQDDVVTLASSLTSNTTTDREKITRIFRWITDNISYRVPEGRMAIIGAASKRFYEEGDDEPGPLRPLNERVAAQVLRTRVAVCDGYARLFTVLCDQAGIQSAIIVGFARSNENKPSPKFGVNHYWNAVYLEGRWQLLDATWASGYVTRDERSFVRSYDDTYFLTDPRRFIRDHFPDDPRWTLGAEGSIPEEFRHSPFRHKSFSKYGITSWSPSKGVIDAQLGEELILEFETRDPERNKNISPDLLIDSALFTHSSGWVFLDPVEYKSAGGIPGKRPVYRYKVESPSVEWLYLKYNDDVVLRYKLNIRKKKTGA